APTSPPAYRVRHPPRPAPPPPPPPATQHPHLIVAGDLRSAHYQRIQTALGSGSEAALRAYYTARDLPTGGTE
ncbi:pyridine nucleotide-disulfide oxidoreductase, partial [Streptomyces sp. NPDC002669]